METDQQAASKWDRAAGKFDLFGAGSEKRWTPWKQEFFSHMGEGRILFAAVTGDDVTGDAGAVTTDAIGRNARPVE